jgi:ribose transport system substrate-binding protein
MSNSTIGRSLILATALALAGAVGLAGCVSNEPEQPAATGTSQAAPAAVSDNDAPGDKVVIGLSAPAADHGWMGAITSAAVAEAQKYSDIELNHPEGTNDVNQQISQIETFINDKVDVIVVLPFDGAALTDVAAKAMDAGIPVVNIDREFSSPLASRVTVLGDNYAMGVSAGAFICERLGDNPDAVIGEVAGIDNLPLTQDRSQGFKDALDKCGLDVANRVAADFTVQGGEAATSNLLQALPKIDALWNHDDDQGVGVLAAIEQAGRDEFFMVGGAGSSDVMDHIKAKDSVLEATVVYPSTQAADGIRLARLLVQGKALVDIDEVEVPRRIVLYAPVVTADNVDLYLPTAFKS